MEEKRRNGEKEKWELVNGEANRRERRWIEWEGSEEEEDEWRGREGMESERSGEEEEEWRGKQIEGKRRNGGR